MRIGIDARELQGRPTGAGRYLRNLLRSWPNADPDTLIGYFDGPPPAGLDLAGLATRAVGDGGTRGWRWQQDLLPRHAACDDLDVLFSPAYACPVRAAVPRVTTLHDLSFFALPWDFTLRDGARRRALARAAAAVSRRVIAVSDFTAREIRRILPGAGTRVVTIPHGADDDLPAAPERAQARRDLGLDGCFSVVCVGSLLNRRRFPELLAAVAHAARSVPELRLDVIGDDRGHPPLQPAARIAAAGLAGRVRWTGFCSEAELARRYAAADAAVYLSEYEGFGLPVIEALRRGLPTLTARRPALDELFGGASLLVEPDDPVAIARTLSRLARDTGLRARLSEAGARHVAGWSWREAARRTRAVLAEAAGR